MIIKCSFCGKEVEATGTCQMYCSVKCRKAAYKKKPKTAFTCVYCGKTYLAINEKNFCNPKCRKDYKASRNHVPKRAEISILEIQKAARKAGMSYGKYVAKMGVK